MIVPMKKVSLVILNREKEAALKALRASGLIHLEHIEGKGEKLSELKNVSARLTAAEGYLGEIKLPKKAGMPDVSNEEAVKKASRAVEITERKKALLDKIAASASEIERLEAWGQVRPADFAYLSQKGIHLSLYEIPRDKYPLIGENVKTLLVNSSKSTKRFLVLNPDAESLAERPEGLPPEAYAVVMPEKSTEEIAAEIKAAEDEVSSIEKEMAELAVYVKAISKANKALEKEIEFENVASGMASDAASSETDMSEGAQSDEKGAGLCWLTGFVPDDSMAAIKKLAAENNWAILAEEPAEEDNVPTKLKNNKLVSLIYPLTDFLDVTPGYHEFDISSWFLLFFCIFFAMIFADAGYGALIALLGLGLLAKAKPGKKSLPVLVVLLGACTCVWGVLTCSWFGISADKLPPALVDLSSRIFSQPKLVTLGMSAEAAKSLADKNQQVFCFVLALIQLSIAHITCTAAHRKSLKCLGDFGSLLQLWGTFYVVLSMVVADGVNYVFPLVDDGNPVNLFGLMVPSYFPTIALGVLAFGFLLNFIFANYEGSVGKSILESLKNIISVFLGIVNVFSDIVSYIRLWAVALAGAAISGTVNQMAGPMFGKLTMFVFAVILLVFGHGLNMMLNLLSVIVHGVRLNTLEFSQHLGMAWSGTKYKPFSEAV